MTPVRIRADPGELHTDHASDDHERTGHRLCGKRLPKNQNSRDDRDDRDDRDEDEIELAELRKERDELKAQLEELKAAKEELDKIKAEREQAELDQKKNELREYAIAEGLNVEDENVARAIDEMDHASLMSEVMNMKNSQKEANQQVAFVASFGISQKGTSYLLGHSKD